MNNFVMVFGKKVSMNFFEIDKERAFGVYEGGAMKSLWHVNKDGKIKLLRRRGKNE